MLKLLSIDKHYNWDLEKGSYLIGRSSGCDFRIEDGTVSRQHAKITVDNDGIVTIEDLGSHNGTCVNGGKIQEPIIVKADDDIQFGHVDFVLVKGDQKPALGSVGLQGEEYDLSNATMYPLQTTLRPLPSRLLDNPRIFSIFSEMGKMLVVPGLGIEMYDRALALLSEIIPAERLALFFMTDDLKEVNLAAQRFSKGRNPGKFVMSQTIIKHIVAEKNAVIIANLGADQRFRDQHSIIISGVKSMMAVPLQDEGKIIGILYADTASLAHKFSEDLLKVMATFGNLLAAKVNNYRLLQDRRARETIEAELAVATEIQKKLLPQTLPKIDRYYVGAFQAQCEAVGGDLYDAAQLKDGRLIFIIADVSGKGTGAALLASNILASFRILYNTPDFDLVNSTIMVSDQLLRHSFSGNFATMFIGYLDQANDTVHYVNAGHNPPMIIRSDGSVEYLESSGIPIGIFDMHNWKEETIHLEPGDFLYAYTDGVIEAESSNGEQFGEERQLKLLLGHKDMPIDQLPIKLTSEIEAFLGGLAPQSCDDITMVVIKREN